MKHHQTVTSLLVGLVFTLCCGLMTAKAEMKAEFWPLDADIAELGGMEFSPTEEYAEPLVEARVVTPVVARGEAITDEATGMAFVAIGQGCFLMGNEKGYDDAKHVHKVCVDDFYMGQYEVTQEQWLAIADENPARFADNPNFPIEQVSWDDVQTYIEKLNQQSDGFYRLPTEAEWEYAARAGQDSLYSGGDEVDEVAWYDRNSDDTPHVVGGKQPNAFGLYDMSGNVGEWCSDWYSEEYYPQSESDNPQGPTSGKGHSYRGGSWQDYRWLVSTTMRAGGKENYRYSGLGLRLVYSPTK